MKNKTFYVKSILLVALLMGQITAMAQQPVLKHSYTFDDGTANDQAGTAHATVIGGAIADGKLYLKENGQYLSLPAKDIAINQYAAITLEAYITTQPENGANTMIAYFGNTYSIFGIDYLFQAAANGGVSKSSVSCKNGNEAPWSTETYTFSNPLTDDQLHYIVTTFDSKTLKLYVDGKLMDEKAVERAENSISNLGAMVAYLGKSGYSSDPTWKGAFDTYNIYEGIVDAETIAQRAKAYLPAEVLQRTNVATRKFNVQMAVDQEESFETPITGKTILFTELIPEEQHVNNRVDELLSFSDVPMNEWSDFSAAVRLSGISHYMDVYDENVHRHHEMEALPVIIDEVYQCWIELNVPNNTYSLFAKTADMKSPVLIWKDARFRKKVNEIRYWSTLHNRQYEDDQIKTTVPTAVASIGAFPAGYVASQRKPAFSIANDPVPARAVVINDPQHGYVLHTQISLKKLMLTDETTELYFVSENRPGHWNMVKSNATITPAGSDTPLKLLSATGIKLDTEFFHPASGQIEYKLVFPKLPEGTKTFHYGDNKTDHYWLIMNIVADTNVNRSTSVLSGYWSDVKTGDWAFAMLDETIIYQNKVWQHEPADLQQKKGKITLTNRQEKLLLSYQVKGDKLVLSSAQSGKITLSKTVSYTTAKSPSNPPAFISPILKPDTAYISGYLHGFTEEIGSNTMTLSVSNVFTGNRESILIRVDKDGTFRAAVPLCQPQLVFMDGGLLNRRNLFLEPGKELFLVHDLTTSDELHYAGINARLNVELANHQFYPANEDYSNQIQNILNLSPEAFRDYAMSYRQKRQDELSAYVKNKKQSDRYHQLQQSEIEITILRDVLHFHFLSQNAETEADPNARNQPGFYEKYKLPTDPEFYTFITSNSVNNDINLLAGSYANLINASIYSPMFAKAENEYNGAYGILSYPSFYAQLNDDDQKFVNQLENTKTPEFNKLILFYTTNSRALNILYDAYKDLLIQIRKDSTEYNPFLKLFEAMKELPDLSDEDKLLVADGIKYFGAAGVSEFFEFQKKNMPKITELLNDAKSFQYELKAISQTAYLDKVLGITPGLYADLIFSQNVIRNASDEMTPINDDLISGWQDMINTPVIYNQMVAINDGIKAKIAENKAKNLATVNDTPEAEAGKIFETIISKYEGKVIYVDFWATWCGPCRQSMKDQTSMKAELKDENIVFLYITDPSSPLETYNNMIPNIQGEHYRLTNDEYNQIQTRFNINSIPRYLIINKKGEVIDHNAPRDPDTLLPRFRQLMAE